MVSFGTCLAGAEAGADAGANFAVRLYMRISIRVTPTIFHEDRPHLDVWIMDGTIQPPSLERVVARLHYGNLTIASGE